MKEFWLTREQLRELRTAHRSERNRHAAYKINAVIFLGDGWSLREVRGAPLLDDETLRSYVDKCRAGGVEELIKTHYMGRASQLDESQGVLLSAELKSKIHLTTSAVIEYAREAFGIDYGVSGRRDLLHRLGYDSKGQPAIRGSRAMDNAVRPGTSTSGIEACAFARALEQAVSRKRRSNSPGG